MRASDKGGVVSFRPCGAKLADAMQYVCKARVWNTAYSKGAIDGSHFLLFIRQGFSMSCPDCQNTIEDMHGA